MYFRFFFIATLVNLSFFALTNSISFGQELVHDDCSNQEFEQSESNFNWSELQNSLTPFLTKQDPIKYLKCAIPSTYGTQYNLPVFMVNSRSLQKSTFQNPRAIFFPDNLTLNQKSNTWLFFSILANSHSFLENKFGSNSIEALQFTLNESNPGYSIEMIDWNLTSRILTRNTPITCQKCHGINPRFLWNESFFWPGAAMGISKYRTEEEFTNMKDALLQSNRTSFIKDFTIGTHQSRLNQLNRFASAINNFRLNKKIKATPDYDYYKFAILGALSGCNNIEQFLPEQIQSLHINLSTIDSTDLKNGFKIMNTIALKNEVEDQNEIKIRESIKSLLKENNQIFTNFIADLIAIEFEKSKYGKPDFGISRYQDIVLNPVSANLRYIFEARGIGISDWTYDILEGTYAFDRINMQNDQFNLIDLLIKNDAELYEEDFIQKLVKSSPAIKQLYFTKKNNSHINFCNELKTKSIEKLKSLDRNTNSDLIAETRIGLLNEKQNIMFHFTNIDKVPTLSENLGSNPISKKSCTQCHYGYPANYTGGLFSRGIEQNYPLTFLICANCHSDKKNPVGPHIPFNDQMEFNQWLNLGGRQLIQYRLSDEAKGHLNHMPPILRLKPLQKEKILNYINNNQ